jgi:hypothetical protein
VTIPHSNPEKAGFEENLEAEALIALITDCPIPLAMFPHDPSFASPLWPKVHCARSSPKQL